MYSSVQTHFRLKSKLRVCVAAFELPLVRRQELNVPRCWNEVMPENDVIALEFVKHLFNCPHCRQQVTHDWPGNTILFATATCSHCGKEFIITLNEAHTYRGLAPC